MARKYSSHPTTTTTTTTTTTASSIAAAPITDCDDPTTTASSMAAAPRMVRDASGDDFILPKDPFESAQELALSLRVEVETLRLAEAMGEQKGAAKSWAMREVQEEVAKLQDRLESKRRRLEAACFDRDSIRAEYQHWMRNGRRSSLKESIAWLEHASLQMAKA
ncbi:unnamed protein product [Laminaria digitata]